MKGSNDLNHYLTRFKKLNVDRNAKRYTVGKAPHKPILLLSIIILNNNKRIDLANIEPNIYLRDVWSELWGCLEYNRIGPIHLPMYHMTSDKFYNINFKPGVTPSQPKSLDQLNGMVERIYLDQELIEFIEDSSSRSEIINSILNGGYFSEGEIKNLKCKIENIDRSFEYEEKIINQIKSQFEIDHDIDSSVMPVLRDPAFRRVVLSAYEETCAVCGARIITSSGITIIDAAHILPFSKFKNDDVRNGIALCKTHHWLFDKGIISINPHLRVLVSDIVEKEHPENLITEYHKNDVILPDDAEKHPSPIALKWHKENVFQN